MTNKTGFSTFGERKYQEGKDFQEVIDFFVRSGYEVEDVHEDSDYFDKDIDLLIKKNGIEKSVEIKFDEYLDNTTNNFFFEIISNEEKTTAGCFLKSEARILLYYSTYSKNGYFFDLPELKKWFFDVRNDFKYIKDVDKKFKLQSTHTKKRDGSYQHTTIGRLVDKDFVIEDCKNKGIKNYVFNIEKDVFSLIYTDPQNTTTESKSKVIENIKDRSNVGKKWSKDEDEMLKHLYNKGYSLEFLADSFLRSEKGIAYRLQTLGIVEDAEELIKTENNKKTTKTDCRSYTQEMEIFNSLKEKRLSISKEINKPAFIICNDDVLEYMAKHIPTRKEEMLKVPGIKDAKFEFYGEEFLKTINAVLSFYDDNGFNIKTNRHKYTGDFYDEHGFNIEGINQETGDKWDTQGFDIKGTHKETGTQFNPMGYDRNGNKDVDPLEEEKKRIERENEIKRFLG